MTNIHKISLWQKQSLSLDAKIRMTKNRITQWIEHWDGDVYISFSGGKDSTVLCDIAWGIDPTIPAVFSNTGLEFPEIKSFVKSYGDKVKWIKPKMTFRDVITKYGYAVVSKEQSQFIYEVKTGKSEKLKKIRLGSGLGSISKKWRFLINAPFKISERCCDKLKKDPFKIYEKQTGLHPIIGTMASESNLRAGNYLRNGCNSFEAKRPISKPLSFWTESDIYSYIKINKLKISPIYELGYNRTGCMFCIFGQHMKRGEPNNFQMMKETHPKQYKFCIETLGLGKVLDYMGIDYTNNQLDIFKI